MGRKVGGLRKFLKVGNLIREVYKNYLQEGGERKFTAKGGSCLRKISEFCRISTHSPPLILNGHSLKEIFFASQFFLDYNITKVLVKLV